MYFSRPPNIPGHTFADFHNINFFELQSGKSMSLPSMSRRLHCEWKKVKSCCTAQMHCTAKITWIGSEHCILQLQYESLHYTVIWFNALFWTQLNHAVHYATAPLHCIALICITLCKHEHCTVHWQCSPVTLGCTIHWTMHCVTSLSTSLSLH